jgi:hypothetical protein
MSAAWLEALWSCSAGQALLDEQRVPQQQPLRSQAMSTWIVQINTVRIGHCSSPAWGPLEKSSNIFETNRYE